MEENKKAKKRLRSLMATTSVTAILLIAASYAWFIGNQDVKVNSFEVKIGSFESLELSLDAVTWSRELTLNRDNILNNGGNVLQTIETIETGVNSGSLNVHSVAYSGNKNVWPQAGLAPISTTGELDKDNGVLKLYELGALATTAGGYRIVANKIDNSSSETQKGYIAFDLFIKNYTGGAFFSDAYATDSTEAVYLTRDSAVKAALGGSTDRGLENSARVSFSMIGYVSSFNSSASNATSLTCSTGNAESCVWTQIWEPNENKHTALSINNFNTVCKKREGLNTVSTSAYAETACDALTQTNNVYDYKPTYSINKPILSSNDVDVFDGYNGYSANTTGDSNFLKAVTTFKDSDKLQLGTARQEFMKLPPNSISKIRVYIYLEGQDIDNADFASATNGEIYVNFGFTKNRLDNYTTSSGI